MLHQKTLRHIAVCSISLPTFAASPSVAKATVYMPSQVAARVFGGRPSMHAEHSVDAQSHQPEVETSHAA